MTGGLRLPFTTWNWLICHLISVDCDAYVIKSSSRLGEICRCLVACLCFIVHMWRYVKDIWTFPLIFTTLKKRGRRFGETPSNSRAIISVVNPFCENKTIFAGKLEYWLLVDYVTSSSMQVPRMSLNQSLKCRVCHLINHSSTAYVTYAWWHLI